MAKKYIDREAALTAIKVYCPANYEAEMLARIVCIPAADVVEVKYGKWTRHYVGQEKVPWGSDCSVCGEWLVIDRLVMQEKYHYCPNCGAKMEVDGE